MGDDSRGRPSKVVRLIEEYDLEGVGEELEHLWTADDPDERRSLRDLADYFNRRLLEVALSERNVQTVDGEGENIYRLLTDDDVSADDRIRMERRLERDGVDVDGIRSAFASYQAIRTYLTEHREVEYESQRTDRVESVDRSVQRLRSRTATVTEDKLTQLDAGDEITLGDAQVTVDVRVYCPDCDRQFEVGALLERGGCDCSD